MKVSPRYAVGVLLLITIACLLLITTTTSAAPTQFVLSSGNVSKTAVSQATLLPFADASFEQFPSGWEIWSRNQCNPVDEWSLYDEFPDAYDGTHYFLGAGTCGLEVVEREVNYVAQTVTIEPGMTDISLWYQVLRTDADDPRTDDFGYVRVGGEIIWRVELTQVNNTTAWQNALIDVTAFAGQTVEVRIVGSSGPDGGNGYFLVDQVSFLVQDIGNPAIDVEIEAREPMIDAGETAVFDVTVTNAGDTTLSNIAVTDSKPGAACAKSIGSLSPTQSNTYSCEVTGLLDNFTQSVTVTGQDQFGTNLSDTDSATVQVLVTDIDVEVSTSTPTVGRNGTAVFEVAVTNLGNTPLLNVTVESENAPNCDKTYAQIAPGVTRTYPCTKPNVTQSFLNEVVATAVNSQARQVSATDSVFIDVQFVSGIALGVTPNQQTVVKHDAAEFTIFLFNVGEVPLENVQVTSETVPDCNFTISLLPVGADIDYDCEKPNVEGPLVNTVIVVATEQGTGGEVGDLDIGIVDVLSMDMVMTATQTQLESPGGTVRFNVTITNDGSKPLTLEHLSGAVLGNQTDPSPVPFEGTTCQMGITFRKNNPYQCSVDIEISGGAGNYQVQLAANAMDNDEVVVTASDQTAVTLTAPPISHAYLPLLANNYIFGEPNDTCTQAFSINQNQTYQFLPDDVYDFYRVTLSTSANLVVEVTDFQPVQGQLLVYRGTCTNPVFLGSNGDFSTTKTVNLGTQPAGNYIIWVINDGAYSSTNPYNLIVRTR